jgi:hypothetical protein
VGSGVPAIGEASADLVRMRCHLDGVFSLCVMRISNMGNATSLVTSSFIEKDAQTHRGLL